LNIAYIFRKRRPGAFSIESLFDNLYEKISQDPAYKVRRFDVPSVRSVLKNIFYAREHRAAICHITGDIHYVALGLSKSTTILTIHDCVFLTRFSKWNIKYWLFKWLWYDIPMRSAAIVTVISEKTKREVLRLTGEDASKIRVIPNFYDPRFRFVPKDFNTQLPRILQIGTKKNKNISRVAAALKGIPCELHIVGEIEQEDKEVLKKNDICFFIYQGLSFEELKQQYELCDMVVFASTYEGFGLPILEASAVGRPLVTSCISPMNEIAGDAASKVNPYNILDIRRGILRVIEDEAYRSQLLSNAKRIRDEYSIDRILAKYVAIYQGLPVNK